MLRPTRSAPSCHALGGSGGVTSIDMQGSLLLGSGSRSAPFETGGRSDSGPRRWLPTGAGGCVQGTTIARPTMLPACMS